MDDDLIFENVNICHDGFLHHGQTLQFSAQTGLITFSTVLLPPAEILFNEESTPKPRRGPELGRDDIVAPGLLELQTNGLAGVHFTTLTKDDHEQKLQLTAKAMAREGVTGWYATIPTVAEHHWKEILPFFKPRSFSESRSSPLLGVHVEGPYLHPLKKGAHNDTYFLTPSLDSYRDVYGEDNLKHIIKYITIAPELDGALEMIRDISESFPHIVISLGHSTASYELGVRSIEAGARCLTHVFNAMMPLHHREPGLAGLIAQPVFSGDVTPTQASDSPCFTVIPDLVHLHPAILRVCYQSNPQKCVLITDSIELAGLPDGIYPPNGQITYPQRKIGNRATNVADVSDGEVETLIGSCITLSEGVRNIVSVVGISLAESVRCASTNIAALMKDDSRGKLVAGRRADFVILDKLGNVKQTWISGRLIYNTQADKGMPT